MTLTGRTLAILPSSTPSREPPAYNPKREQITSPVPVIIADASQIAQEAFIDLYSQPILSELYEVVAFCIGRRRGGIAAMSAKQDLKVHLGGELPPPLPEQGQREVAVTACAGSPGHVQELWT